MSKHEIEVEGLPEGWDPVAIRKQKLGEHVFCLDTGCVVPADHRTPKAHLIVKKKQPRRIVLEDTGEDRYPVVGDYVKHASSNMFWECVDPSRHVLPARIWREVKETEEPKLCLSVEECEEIVCNDYPIPVDLSVKIHNFLSAINKTS